MPGWKLCLLIPPHPQFVLTIFEWFHPFPLTLLKWNMSTSFYQQWKVTSHDSVCIFCCLYHHINSRRKTRDKKRGGGGDLPRLPSGKVELKLERGIMWSKAPRGREREWKKRERKGDRGSVMGCCCSVLGMIKQWGWIRALSYDKHMDTQTQLYRCPNTHTAVSLHSSTCLLMDRLDCTALTHPWLHVKPQGASDWQEDTNGVKQESCWEWQISGCGDAPEVYVGSSSRPSALSFDLQWGTAFDVLIISLNRAQGFWGKGEQRGGERREATGQAQGCEPCVGKGSMT